MSRVVVDTNVLISFLTDRDPPQQETAASLFGQAAGGELELILHQTVIIELVYVLRNLYDLPDRSVAGLLGDLLALPGVAIVDELPWSLVLELWPETFSEFADGCLAAVARQANCEAVATFDQRFASRLRADGIKAYI